MRKTNALGLLVVSGGLLLSGCSDREVEQSSESFSAAADVHSDAVVVEDTKIIDQIIIDQDRGGNWSASVFETETVLLENEDGTASIAVDKDTSEPNSERRAFYGDLHVHTE